MIIDLGTSSVVASTSYLVELLLPIFWAVFTGFSRFLVVAMVVSIPLISLDIYSNGNRISNNLQNRDFRMISQFCYSEQHMITSFSFDHFFFFLICWDKLKWE